MSSILNENELKSLLNVLDEQQEPLIYQNRKPEPEVVDQKLLGELMKSPMNESEIKRLLEDLETYTFEDD